MKVGTTLIVNITISLKIISTKKTHRTVNSRIFNKKKKKSKEFLTAHVLYCTAAKEASSASTVVEWMLNLTSKFYHRSLCSYTGHVKHLSFELPNPRIFFVQLNRPIRVRPKMKNNSKKKIIKKQWKFQFRYFSL